ncbi:MAG: ATP-binding protein [Candidatus Omnitrophota bacterium]|nr:ATP-binding protein [Candidatus Omnitrophota bacterium]
MDKIKDISVSLKKISGLLSLFIFFCSLVILFGWILDIPTVKSILPYMVAIKVNTTICFVLTGLALWLLQEKRMNNRVGCRVACVLALLVLLIGFLTFIEYVLGINLRIDQLLFREPVGAILTSSPNRMSFISAINFMLIGTALLCLQSKKEFFCYLGQSVVLMEALFSMEAILGYIYGGALLYLPIKYSTVIALNATVLFILVSICILFMRPRCGFMKTVNSDGSGGTIMRTIWPVAIILPMLLGWFKLYWEREKIFTNEIGVSFVAIANLILVTVYIYILCRKLNLLDIEHKKSEQALIDSEARYRSLFENMQDGFAFCQMIFDGQKPVDFIYLSANDAFERLTGLKNVVGKKVTDVIPGIRDTSADLFDIYGRVALTGVPEKFEIYISALGRWFSVSAYSMQKGKFVAVFDNITERKNAEEKIRWLAEFPELAPIPICEINIKGEITYCNPAADHLLPDLRKLGLKHPWLVGSNWIIDNFRSGKIETYSREVKIKKGVYEQNIFYIPDKQCVRIYGFDVTVRKRITEVLQESAKTKSAFTSMVSHELRTPLSALKESVAQILEGTLGTLTEDQREFLGIAKRNVDRLSRLITEVLDFQTLEAGKMAFKMQDNDINEVIKETKEIMDIVAKEKRLDFILNLEEGLPKIKFDRDKISQVLANLVNNSLKFTEKGSISISTTKGHNVVQVLVKDTGSGIKEEDRPRLFQQYEQLVRKTGGTGLGLAISLEIIKAHGGEIWAESKFGQGTIMYFTLPIKGD